MSLARPALLPSWHLLCWSPGSTETVVSPSPERPSRAEVKVNTAQGAGAQPPTGGPTAGKSPARLAQDTGSCGGSGAWPEPLVTTVPPIPGPVHLPGEATGARQRAWSWGGRGGMWSGLSMSCSTCEDHTGHPLLTVTRLRVRIWFPHHWEGLGSHRPEGPSQRAAASSLASVLQPHASPDPEALPAVQGHAQTPPPQVPYPPYLGLQERGGCRTE